MSNTDRYMYSVPGRDEYRFYGICESEDGDGWFICWHAQSGEAHHHLKKIGKFDLIEDAQSKLDELAVEMGMKYWKAYPEPTRSGLTGEWLPVKKKQQTAAPAVEEVSARKDGDHSGSYGSLPVELIHPNEFNPRKHFDEIRMSELVGSIKAQGLLEPIVVRAGKQGHSWEIICGERRWRAAKLAGLEIIPCRFLEDIDDRTALELALVENLVRADLDPIEEAEGYRQLSEMGYKQIEIAERVNRSQEAVSNAIRLLKLPEPVQELVSGGKITVSHAKALLPHVERPKILEALAEKAADGATVKEIESLDYNTMGILVKKNAARSLWSYDAPWAQAECTACKYRMAGPNDSYYCLNVDCWNWKKAAYDKAEKQRVKEIAEKQAEGGVLNLNSLKPGQWASLCRTGECPEELGCPADCEHMKEATWEGRRDTFAVCLNLECYTERQQALEARLTAERDRLKAEQSELLESLMETEGIDHLIPLLCIQALRCVDASDARMAAKKFKAKLDSDGVTAQYPGSLAYDEVHLKQLAQQGPERAVKLAVFALLFGQIRRGNDLPVLEWLKGAAGSPAAAETEGERRPATLSQCETCAADVDDCRLPADGSPCPNYVAGGGATNPATVGRG